MFYSQTAVTSGFTHPSFQTVKVYHCRSKSSDPKVRFVPQVNCRFSHHEVLESKYYEIRFLESVYAFFYTIKNDRQKSKWCQPIFYPSLSSGMTKWCGRMKQLERRNTRACWQDLRGKACVAAYVVERVCIMPVQCTEIDLATAWGDHCPNTIIQVLLTNI